jgi:hypothetical protein
MNIPVDCNDSRPSHKPVVFRVPVLRLGRTWLIERKRLRVQSEISDERAQPLAIDVRVARGCCDAFMAEKRLDVAQVGSALP